MFLEGDTPSRRSAAQFQIIKPNLPQKRLWPPATFVNGNISHYFRDKQLDV